MKGKVYAKKLFPNQWSKMSNQAQLLFHPDEDGFEYLCPEGCAGRRAVGCEQQQDHGQEHQGVCNNNRQFFRVFIGSFL